jgi:hypothetical protein
VVRAVNTVGHGRGLEGVMRDVVERWNFDVLDPEGMRSLRELLSQKVMLAEVQFLTVCGTHRGGIARGGQFRNG